VTADEADAGESGAHPRAPAVPDATVHDTPHDTPRDAPHDAPDAASDDPLLTRIDGEHPHLPGPGSPARGTLLGRYSLLRKLGEGGMGVVYSAYDEELDRRVAIKLLRIKDGAGPLAATRMLREAQAMARLSHPNVVQVYDTGELSGQVFLAMEFVQGETLREWLNGPDGAPRATPRPWREVLAMYLQAGQGLAAAHAVGLVHRDFKPDNVLVGADGRARVLDFGLARTESTRPEPGQNLDEPTDSQDPAADEDLERSRSHSRRSRPAALQLTAAGTTVGTPAYMSPEQHLRISTAPRSDQFSFCVSLYEGLHGERPFAGDTASALRIATLTGRVREPPPGRKVPAWLRKVLLRGLRVLPDERYPDMDALLLALSADPGRARRRWLAGLGLVAAALSTGLLIAERRSAEAELCRHGDDLLAGVWDSERAAAVEAALAATGRGYARDAWPRVQEQLDMYARTWREMHVEVCEATHVRRVQSPRLMDLRIACLHERRAELRAVALVLSGADERVAERAVQVAAGLRPLTRCADTEALALGRDPPDPSTAAAVQAVREQLSQVRAEDAAGRFAQGLGLARAAVLAATDSGHEPVRAEALLHRGRMEQSAGDYAAAERSLEEAYWLAESLAEDATRAEAALRLLLLVGEPRARDHDAMQWGHQAEALLHRLGDPPELEAPLRANLGVVHTRFGRYDDALAALQRAIALETRPQHPQLAVYHRDLGNVHYRRGRWVDAEAAYALAITLGEAALGPDHPENARTINNLGEAHRVQGHLEAAERCFTRSLAVWERAFGPDHPMSAPPLNGLGTLAFNRGDMTTAAAHFERVRVLLERSHGPAHPDVGAVTSNLGEILLRQGALAQSQQASERALEILSAALGPEHDGLADVHCNLARALALQGQLEPAAEHFTRALTSSERAHGPDAAQLAKPLTGQGLLALLRGRPAEAIPAFERALALGGLQNPVELAELRLGLARALWDTRQDRPRARLLAEQARAGLVEAGPNPASAEISATVDRWLADHPAP
jgi:tetratricopeptide (TPR) repeat protein/tRNA A-37 threonylcarbamoyl transferase component Bud32